MIKKLVSNATVNVKTTVGGVVAFLAMFFTQIQHMFDADAATNPDWNMVVAAFAALWVGLQARDGDKSTEDNVK